MVALDRDLVDDTTIFCACCLRVEEKMKPVASFADFKSWIGTRAAFVRALTLALLMLPTIVEAQHDGKMRRIAYVSFPERPPATATAGLEVFRQALRERGWVEGKNYVLEMRLGASEEKLPEVSAQVVREKFDLILVTNTFAAVAAREVTTTVPIVMAGTCDPVACGVVGSLARPGGNVTGITIITSEVAGKRVELLKEAVPGLKRIAALTYGDDTFCVTTIWMNQSEATARALGITLQRLHLNPGMGAEQWDMSFAALRKDGVGAVTVIEGPIFLIQAPQIAAASLKHGLPTVFAFRSQAVAGGLLSYGANTATMFRRGAYFVDRIFRGAKPGDLPIEQPTEFELTVNLKTAKALGITIPSSLRLRADHVIE
jgi:putative ABC transport system substrate-binding protein